MGRCTIYQALPERSVLFERISKDRPIRLLFIVLFNQGRGPLHLRHLEKTSPEALAQSDEYEDLDAVKRAFFELESEADRAIHEHPGLTERYAFLQKSEFEIERRLTAELARRGINEVEAVVRRMIFGEDGMWPDPDIEEWGLGLVRARDVRIGADLLKPIEPDTLFGVSETESANRDDYKALRDLYIDASERDEVIVMRSS